MQYKTYLFPLLLTTCVLNACAQLNNKITYNDPMISYMGRINKTDSASIIYWSGTSATISFNGTAAAAELKDEKGKNCFYAIVDGAVQQKLHLDTTRHTYQLAGGLKKGPHTIQLFKLTEESAGKTWLYGFSTDGKAASMHPRKHTLQFYGNSITAGYSVDDTVGDSGNPDFFNNYYTYAAITARYFDANYTNISKSGIGVLISWFPIIMPELYDRLDPLDSVHRWDYNGDKADVVVVDLFQNDSWLIKHPEHAQFKARFGTQAPGDRQIIDAYKHFIQTLRTKHPKATIICTLGSMDATKEGSPWPGFVQQAVDELNDKKVTSLFFPYKRTPGHPKRKEQQAMAETLIKFINQVLK
jgi:hypothetical protein